MIPEEVFSLAHSKRDHITYTLLLPDHSIQQSVGIIQLFEKNFSKEGSREIILFQLTTHKGIAKNLGFRYAELIGTLFDGPTMIMLSRISCKGQYDKFICTYYDL